MRVCLVSQEYPPETAKGGIGTQTFLQAHGLAALGHQVIVLSHSVDEKFHESSDQGVKVIRIPGFDSRLPLATEPARWLTYSAQVAAALSALNAEKRLDLVVFPEWGGEGYIHLLNQSEWNSIPAVVHIHGSISMFAHYTGWPETNSEFYRVAAEMERTCLRLAGGVCSSSRFSADWCAKQYQLRRGPIPVLHTGVDTEIFFPRPVPKESRPTILFAGSVTAQKGVPLLVNAACRLAPEFPRLQLRILGSGEANFVKELKQKAASSGLPDLLVFEGFVPRENLAEHFSRAHVFAGPSVFEGGPGFVYLEAMACGLPVIACEGSGVTEIVTHPQNGILIPPQNEEALTRALRELLSNAEKRAAMGGRAHQYVLDHAASKDCLKRIETFYLSFISSRVYS
ncbi:MAG TPA: glycosyltransferase family 4 protein [bacterium]|nr:glycosyltransferase family 4 protein [bacterium]